MNLPAPPSLQDPVLAIHLLLSPQITMVITRELREMDYKNKSCNEGSGAFNPAGQSAILAVRCHVSNRDIGARM